MFRPTQIAIPTLVRVKEGALDRVGLYLQRADHRRVAVLLSQGLVAPLQERVKSSLANHAVEVVTWVEIANNELESAARFFVELPTGTAAVVGVGGGKALDGPTSPSTRLPYYAVPTSLSNDGFVPPVQSLTIRGQRAVARLPPSRSHHRHGRAGERPAS